MNDEPQPYDEAEQLRSLELCVCGETRGVHFRTVLKGDVYAPCALCPCPDFKPEDYAALDISETESII